MVLQSSKSPGISPAPGLERPLGIQVRSGLHTGEIELTPDDVAGIAVHIAARVAEKAGSGEVLVSSTVRDLVAGSGLRFGDRGSHVLRGFPEPLRLFAAELSATFRPST
jgi:class 3 adenylate cyclase